MLSAIGSWFRSAGLKEWMLRLSPAIPVGIFVTIENFWGIPLNLWSGHLAFIAICIGLIIVSWAGLGFVFGILSTGVALWLYSLAIPYSGFLSVLGALFVLSIGTFGATLAEQGLRERAYENLKDSPDAFAAFVARHFLRDGHLTPGSWEFDVFTCLRKGSNDKALALIIENTDMHLVNLFVNEVFDRYVEDKRILEVTRNLRGLTDQRELLNTLSGLAKLHREKHNVMEMPESVLRDAFQVIEDMSRGAIENRRVEEEQRLRNIVKDIARDKA